MPARLRLFVDSQIPHAVEVFSLLGEVTPFDGYDIVNAPEALEDAQILVTRSVTRIDDRLLSHCPNLLALASPTIGTDHVDFFALELHRARTGRPIPFFNAPGATAGGVADFTLACILLAASALQKHPKTLHIGIWGFGNCGSALARRLNVLSIPWTAYDPPKAEREGFRTATLDDILECDVISLHVPLTYHFQSQWPTYHMVSRELLSRLGNRPRILINTSRGPVIDNEALLESAEDLIFCLDVWEGEPTPNCDLVRKAFLSSPHCAGSVIEGRLRSLKMVYEALRDFAAPKAPQAPSFLMARSPIGPFSFPNQARDFLEAVGVERLSSDFKAQYLAAEPWLRGKVFDTLRVQRTRHEICWDALSS